MAAERPGSAQQKHVYRGQSALRLWNRRDWQARERRTALYVTVVCSARHQLPMFILSASVVWRRRAARDKGESGARLGRSIRVGRRALHVTASALSRDRHVRREDQGHENDSLNEGVDSSGLEQPHHSLP